MFFISKIKASKYWMPKFTQIETEHTRNAIEAAQRSIEHFDPDYPDVIHLHTSSPKKREGAAQAFRLLGIDLPIQAVDPTPKYVEPVGPSPSVSINKANVVDRVPTRGSVAIAGAGFDGSVQVYDRDRQEWIDLHRISRFVEESGILTLPQIIARFNLLCRLLVEQKSLIRRVHSVTLKNGRQMTISETAYQRVNRMPRRVLSRAVERAVGTKDFLRFAPGVPLAELTQDLTKRVAFVPGTSSNPNEWYPEYKRWSEPSTKALYDSYLRDVQNTFPAIVLLRGL